MEKGNRTYAEILNQEHKNYTEDYEHENGKYLNSCHECGFNFIGHKRRVICKECLNNNFETIWKK